MTERMPDKRFTELIGWLQDNGCHETVAELTRARTSEASLRSDLASLRAENERLSGLLGRLAKEIDDNQNFSQQSFVDDELLAEALKELGP